MTWVLKILLAITILSTLGVKTSSFIAILGAIGLAIGFSLKDSLSNFAGGLLIIDKLMNIINKNDKVLKRPNPSISVPAIRFNMIEYSIQVWSENTNYSEVCSYILTEAAKIEKKYI